MPKRTCRGVRVAVRLIVRPRRLAVPNLRPPDIARVTPPLIVNGCPVGFAAPCPALQTPPPPAPAPSPTLGIPPPDAQPPSPAAQGPSPVA